MSMTMERPKRKPTLKQKAFARAYVEKRNGAEAAREVYNVTTDNSARSVASENLTKPNVQKLIQDFAEQARANIEDIANDKENVAPNVRLRANETMLDRAGHGAISKQEIKRMNVDISLDGEDMAQLGDIKGLLGG